MALSSGWVTMYQHKSRETESWERVLVLSKDLMWMGGAEADEWEDMVSHMQPGV